MLSNTFKGPAGGREASKGVHRMVREGAEDPASSVLPPKKREERGNFIHKNNS